MGAGAAADEMLLGDEMLSEEVLLEPPDHKSRNRVILGTFIAVVGGLLLRNRRRSRELGNLR